jgi:hypothetical protein
LRSRSACAHISLLKVKYKTKLNLDHISLLQLFKKNH